MSPVYKQGEAYPHPYPAYFSGPPNVEPQPIWLEPREPQPHYYYREAQPHYYYRETPKRPWSDEWSSSDGRPYMYHYPTEGGNLYYPPKYRNSPARFYEPYGMDFGRERFYDPDGREFRRDFRPIYVDFPYSPAHGPYAQRPFHPGEQFRHPDEYPMRFVPVSYEPSEQRKSHCCGCPNHVCHPDTKTMKEIEPKQITDGKCGEELKPNSPNLQKFPGPVVVFPSRWRNRASSPERKDHIEENEKHPVHWIPVNWNRNDREPSRDTKGEDKEQNPVYWFPVNWTRNDQIQEHDPRFQGYLTPLASNTSLQDEKGNKKDGPEEGKSHPFPLIWIPEGRWNVSNTNTQDESKSPTSQASSEDAKKTNGVESKPVILQEFEKDKEKQRPAEVKKEIKARDIPVKQLEEEKPAESRKAEEKSSQPQKTQGKVGDNHQKTLSPKSSKLPPVCLRVDPLPGKKKCNGKSSSSRSPSPPRISDNSKASATASAPVENAYPDASTKVSVQAKKPEENTKMKVEVKKAEESTKMKDSKKVEEKLDSSTNANIETGKPKEAEKLDDSKLEENEHMQSKGAEVEKYELSKDRAALKIQAFYRGYQVRRLQPLKKLREIAKIRERVKELQQQISIPEFVEELSRDEKVKGRTHETLMGLLLQLDTIQGLHPVVRDVRKAVARELVLLQEKLDTWTEVAPNNNIQQQQSCMQGSTENNVGVEEEVIETNNNIQQQQSCMQGSTENHVGVEEEVIEKDNKDWEATKDSDMTLLNSDIDNQRVDNEASKDEEKAHDKQDPLEIKKEMSDEYRMEASVKEEKSNEEVKEASSKECSDDGKQNAAFDQKDYATEQCENVQGNALLNQEAPEISENVEISELSVVEMGNHDKDSDASEQMITTPGNALDNINDDKEEISEETTSVSKSGEVYLENIKAEVKEKSEPQMNIESVLPQDSDMQTEVSQLSTLSQEQKNSEVGNSTSEPEKNIIEEEIGLSYSEANKTETEDLQNVITEANVGDKHHESSVSCSDGYEENNLNSLEEDPPVEENASRKREFTVALAQETETYNPVNQESVEVEDASDVNSKDEFSIRNEERQEDHTLKCSGLSNDMEIRASVSAEKYVMELFPPKVDSHSENLSESEANMPQYGSKQNEENWEEENGKLREMVEKLVECGKQQMSTIAQLNDKINVLRVS